MSIPTISQRLPETRARRNVVYWTAPEMRTRTNEIRYTRITYVLNTRRTTFRIAYRIYYYYYYYYIIRKPPFIVINVILYYIYVAGGGGGGSVSVVE